MSAKLNYALILIFCCLWGQILAQTPPLLSALVPKIQQEGYELTPEGNTYHLKINFENSNRDEVVELKEPGTEAEELFVKGMLSTYFADGPGYGVSTYEADKNGYRVKYIYEIIRKLEASASFLKTATG